MSAMPVLLLAIVLGPQASPPALTDAIVVDLVKQAPAFRPPAKREGISVSRMGAIAGAEERAYFVEILWREGETYRNAVLTVARTDVSLSPDTKWVVRKRGWGILAIEEDKDWKQLIAGLRAEQARTQESAAISRLQAMASGQQLFAATSGRNGFAADVTCLVTPAACGIDATSGFVMESLGEPERSGYRFTLHPGGTGPVTSGAARVCRHYAYTAEPVGDEPTGRRSFCIDDRGTICEQRDGTTFQVTDGACPALCAPVKPR